MGKITEIWKDVAGYEGLYSVSNLGRVKSHDHEVMCSCKNDDGTRSLTRVVRGTLLKPNVRGNGYLYVSLWKNGKKHLTALHRIVALAFVDNPDNKPCVNHKDFNPQNPAAQNLEWVTQRENVQYSRERLSKGHIGKASIPGESGEIYIKRANNGRFKLSIVRLGVYKTFDTMEEAKAAREVILGW